MENLNIPLKKSLFLLLVSITMLNPITIIAQNDLTPDQNPNYKKSMEKYMGMKDKLTKNQGTTVQATYKAIDDMQIKRERKDVKKANRQKRRMSRIENNGYYYDYNYPYQSNYISSNNNGYRYHYGYNNNSYRSNNRYRSNRYSTCSSYSPYYRPFTSYSTNVGNAALWGLGAYLLLR